MVSSQKSDYEDLRSKRIQENNKRILELNLNALAVDLIKESPKPSSQVKQPKRKTVQKTLDYVQRKSIRNSNKPKPVYIDVVDYGIERARKKRFSNSKRDKTREADFPLASPTERANAEKRAEEFKLSLGNQFPCFVKEMKHSHVNIGFWLGLPGHFCKKYLPTKDADVTLIDENGEEFETNYLANKVGLSGGWAGFSQYHKIINGDYCVFQRTNTLEFKVYIIKAKGVSYGEASF